MKPIWKNVSFLILLSTFGTKVISDSDDSKTTDRPVVETVYGKVQGIKTPTGHYEFKKIPFAKPPINKLRFKEPEEPDPWKGILDVSEEYSDYCIQYNVFWNTTEGVEDCLYISVFTPQHPEELQSSKLPVMVYIHSGGFMFGRGSFFRGDYLMETGKVIGVFFQYRLGSFGFLNTEDEHSYGNMGMKDQNLALRWVQRNIGNFGGNKDNVMIYGTSAGAASVHYHILSPMSKGLFHKAFSGSGTALCPWAFQVNPRENALRLGQLLQCPTDDTKSMVECLRQKDADEIGFAHRKFLQWYVDPIAAFGPSLETGNSDKKSRFLPSHPADIIESGVVNEVPWILGFNSDEGFEHTMTIFKRGNLLNELNESLDKLFPITLEYVNENEDLKTEITKKVQKFYFNNELISEKTLKNLSNAYSDKAYVLGTLESAYRHADLKRTKSHPVYLFLFGYKGEHSIVTLRGYKNENFGTNHMDDIQYLVKCPLFGELSEKSKDKPFQRQYMDMIIRFAISGVLEFKENNVWQPLDPGGDIKWFHIKENPKMEPMPLDWSERIKFWKQFPLQESKAHKLMKEEL